MSSDPKLALTGAVVKHPLTGEDYTAQAIIGIPRAIFGRFNTIGVHHNTNNDDLTAIYMVANIAARHAFAAWLRDESSDNVRTVRFVEVGTWCGESAVATACAILDAAESILSRVQMMRGVPCELVVVDTFEGSKTDSNWATWMSYGGDIQGICRDNVTQLAYQTQIPALELATIVVRGESTAVAQNEPTQSIDFVFIDAGHTYEECKADMLAWWPLLRPGGYMAGHDYDTGFAGVVLAVDEASRELAGCAPVLLQNSRVWFVKKPAEEAQV